MKDYSQIISGITSRPWMMVPGDLKMLLEIVDAHIQGAITRGEIQVRLEAAGARNTPDTKSRNGAVGVLPLHGPIFPKANLLTEMSGAVSLESWVQDFRQMVQDDSISHIVLDVDSPGGSSSMIPEVASEIRAGRDVKPIYAVANTMAGSAAYGLAAQATKFFSTPSGTVGSIGTYLVHTDESPLMERIGVKDTVIKAGRFKAVELESLTPESRAYLEEYVNDVNARFVGEIAQGRGVSTDAILGTEAKMFAPDRAQSVGLIDGIATLEDVVGEIVETGGIQLATSAPAGRQSYDADKEHSEPGTGFGGEPTPREPPETGDPAIEGGWRRDSPPAAFEDETEEAVNREWLEARATALGIEFNSETNDEDLASLVGERSDELVQLVAPLREATEGAERARDFARDYPEQAARMAAMEERDRRNEATEFAQSFANIDGTRHGYSAPMRESIQQAVLQISTREFTADDLSALLRQAATSLVPLGETGSSRSIETDENTTSSGDFQRDRRAFADLVASAMKEDNMTQEAAIAHVSQTHPDLARAYAVGHVGR